MVIFYKKWKKYNGIQWTKDKTDLYNRKMTIYPPSPGKQKGKPVLTVREELCKNCEVENLKF